MTSKPELPTCGICIESFNKSTRKEIKCNFCDAAACRECLQKFLLMDTSTEPKCPSCNTAWSQEYVNEHFTATFRLKTLKNHREKVLYDRERVRLAEAQEDAERFKTASEQVKTLLTQEQEELKKKTSSPDYIQLKKIQERYSQLYTKYTSDYEKIRRTELNSEERSKKYMEVRVKYGNDVNAVKKECAPLKKKLKPFDDKIAEIQKAIALYNFQVKHHGAAPPVRTVAAAGGAGAAATPAPPPKRTYLYKCPAGDCEGFLNSEWTCGICKTVGCKECREIKTEMHVCDPTTVESVKAIAKEAKPCPKCAASISKIDGCDQMWCTQCKTAFSWRTGVVETTIVHNPHYFQWMRETGQVVQRARGDNPYNPCDYYGIMNTLNTIRVNYNRADKKLNTVINWLSDRLRWLGHLDQVTLRRWRRMLQTFEGDDWRRIMRVQRLVGEVNDEKWRITLQRREKEYHKRRALVMLGTMYYNAAMDIYSHITRISEPTALENAVTELKNLWNFVIAQNEKTAKAYNGKPIHFTKTESVDVTTTV